MIYLNVEEKYRLVGSFDEIQVDSMVIKKLFNIQFLIFIPINRFRVSIMIRVSVRVRFSERLSDSYSKIYS